MLQANLPSQPIRVIEVGAGIGTMLRRLLRWDVIHKADYVLVDEMAENIEYASASAGNIFLAGFFGGALQLGDSTLQAEGSTDLFVAQLSPEGHWNWAFREGKTADTRATAITWSSDNQLIIAGFFNGATRIAETDFNANTSDRDAFLAAYSAENGQHRWAVKAGGVFDDDITSIATDEQGRIYAAGYLVGVMTLSPNLSIQSATGNPDFFILQYSAEGTPLLARAMGGSQTNPVTSLTVAGGRIFVCGHYQGAHAVSSFQEACLAAGMDGFLSKPAGLKEIRKVLQQFLPMIESRAA